MKATGSPSGLPVASSLSSLFILIINGTGMDKDLKLKIDEMVANMGNQELADKLLSEAFTLAVTPEDKKEAGQYLLQAMNKRKRPDVEVRNMLGEMTDAISLSYLAKKYF